MEEEKKRKWCVRVRHVHSRSNPFNTYLLYYLENNDINKFFLRKS